MALVGEGRLVSRRILEVPIGVIFDNNDVEFDTNSVNVFAALDTKGSRSRILAYTALGVSLNMNQVPYMDSYVTVYIKCGLFPLLLSQLSRTSNKPPLPWAAIPSSSIATGTMFSPRGFAA